MQLWILATLSLAGYAAYRAVLFVLSVWSSRIEHLPFPSGEPSHFLSGQGSTLAVYAKEKRIFMYFHERLISLGSTFQFRAFHQRSICTSRPGTIARVLGDMSTFPRNANFTEAFGTVARGLLVLEGAEWRRHRRLASAAFYPERLRLVHQSACEGADKLSAKWTRMIEQPAEESPKLGARASSRMDTGSTDASDPWGELGETSRMTTVDAAEAATAYAMDVLGWAGFGFDFRALDGLADEIGCDLKLAFSAIGRRAQMPRTLWPLMPGHAEVEAATQRIHTFMDELIDKRVAEWGGRCPDPVPGDILSLLLAAGLSGDDDALSRDDVRNEGLMFYAAGHETTANTLAWIVHVLAERPSLCAQLCDELREECGLDGPEGHPSHAEVTGGRLKLMDAVINETMRLYPVVAMTGRQAARDCTVEDVRVPKGTNVILSLYTAQRDPEHWGPTAGEFDPHRWLAPGFRPEPGTFTPFGHGAKACIGSKFSLIELKVGVAALVRRFRFARGAGSAEVKPIFTITLGPKDGLSVRVGKRCDYAKFVE